MPRNRVKSSAGLIPQNLLNEIRTIRPLKLFINKQKKRGVIDKPFNLRIKFCKLPLDKQARYLQKSVDQYIELLEERETDEDLQVRCHLFEHLLNKSEQKKYFQSINAPRKPPGTVVPFYNQELKQESYDNDSETSWQALSADERQSYRKKRKEAKSEYTAQVRNFANDLPDRLRVHYLNYAELVPEKRAISTSSQPQSIRQRRKSLTTLPDSLQTDSNQEEHANKLNKSQLYQLHQCMPQMLYYESEVSSAQRRHFPSKLARNAHIRAQFNRLPTDVRAKFILQSVDQWHDFLESNPSITENQLPTLHLLLQKNDDVVLYFSSLGLPSRPPANSYVFYNLEHPSSQQAWSDLSERERRGYTQRLTDLKNLYYANLMGFVENKLTTDYARYEFFRNIKHAMKDYELAAKNHSEEPLLVLKDHRKKIESHHDMKQFQQVKQKLLATELTNEQKFLVEELSQLLYRHIE